MSNSINTDLNNLVGTPISGDEEIMNAIPHDKEMNHPELIAVRDKYDEYFGDILIFDGDIMPHNTW